MNSTHATKTTSLVNDFAKRLESAFLELDHTVDSETIESLAVFLLRTMGSESRDYHRPEHSLDVSRQENAIPRFAGLFHDLIYLQVDPTWRQVTYWLAPFIPNDSLEVNVEEALKQTQDPWLHAIAALFNVEFETKLNTAYGVNEFLSAVVMYKKLSPYLSPSEMLRSLACIEATIFFDKVCAMQKTPEERMRANLERAAKKLKMNSATIDSFFAETVQDCKKIIDRDLSSFASEDLSDFLSNTWNVMIENSQTLRNSYYLISDYHKAIQGVVGFVGSLEPLKMFWGVEGRNTEKTRYNLRVGNVYLKAFSNGLTVIKAVADLTGGDAPYEMFSGPMRRSREHDPIDLAFLLPLPESMPSSNANVTVDAESQKVYSVLKEGRSYRSRFDQKNAPLAAFLFAELGKDKSLELFEATRQPSTDFLKMIPHSTLKVILECLSKTSTARSESILKLTADLDQTKLIA